MVSATSTDYDAQRNQWFYVLLSLLLATFVAYAPALGNSFTLDDEIAKNGDYPTHLREAIYLLTEPIPHGLVLHYRPLTVVTFVIDRCLWGKNPVGYHLTSLLVATLTAFAAFLLAKRFLPWPVAWWAALILAVHPAHSEAVVNIYNRSQLLASLGIFIALNCFWQTVYGTKPGRRWLAAGFVATLAGCLAKETGLVIPMLSVLVWFGLGMDRERRGIALQAIALQLLACALYVTLRTSVVGGLAMPGAEGFVAEQPLWARYFNGCLALTYYLRLTWFPYPLSCDYPWQPVWFHWSGLVYPVALAWAIYAIWKGKARLLACAFLYWIVCLAPVLHILPLPIPFAERFLYPSLWSLACLLAWLISRLAVQRQTVALAILLLSLSLLTGRRCLDWRDNDTLWQATIQTTPASYRAQIYLGAAANRKANVYRQQRFQSKADFWYRQAMAHYQAALQRNPNRHNLILICYNLGVVYYETGQRAKAVASFSRLFAIEPDYRPAYLFLGQVAMQTQDWGKAIACYRKIAGPLNRWDKGYRQAQEQLRKAILASQR